MADHPGVGGHAGPVRASNPRHRLRRTIVVLGVVAGIGAWTWYGWLPHYRPHLLNGERYGIDVSHHQGLIDWELVAAGNEVSFAYIKATEGATHVDSRFDHNWEATARAGITRGAYHFFTLCRSGQEQADNFLQTVPVDVQALPPAIDLELAGNCSARPDEDTVHQELADFLERVETATGRDAVLYLGPRFDTEYQVSATWDRPLWKLRFLRRPDRSDVAVWQVMGFASIDGVRGRVDLNVADIADLQRRPAAQGWSADAPRGTMSDSALASQPDG